MSDRTEELCSNNDDYLLEKANVVGVAGGEDKLLVLVEEKKPLDELDPDDVVDREIDGVQTDVIEVGHLTPKALPAGASIGIPNTLTGTWGGLVEDELGKRYGLTNNHVAANSNQARALQPIVSPGPSDVANGRRIGVLARFEPIYFDRPNHMDAALVALDRGEEAVPFTNPESTTALTGWTVQKFGRTTGHTFGKVIGRNATVDIDFGSAGVARFVNQIITDFMLDSGDSGSVLLSTSGHPCGLGFAGSDTISIHTPINLVLRSLAVRFVKGQQ